jgi:dienelactone hydrolase
LQQQCFALAGCGGGSERAASPARGGLFAYDASAPTDVRVGRVVNAGAPINVRELSYASPRGGRVAAFLVLPRGGGRHPAVIYMHGAGRDRAELLPFAVALADKGFVALTLSSQQTGAPKTGVAGVRQFRDAYVRDVVNVRRAVDVLRARDDVRRDALGYVGFSYGGILGGIVAGVEHRIRAFDLMSAGAAFDATGRGSKVVRELVGSIDPVRYVGRARPSALFLQAGRRDEVVPPRLLRHMYDVASKPKRIRWYTAGHVLNAQAVDDQLAWLQAQLS